MERRGFKLPIRIENRADGQPSIIGYAAVFYQDDDEETQYILWDDPGERAVERIMPGAFDNAMKKKTDVRALFNHNDDVILGRTVSGTLGLTTDKTGLRYEINPPQTQRAAEVIESIRRGDVSGSSFAFIPEDVSWRFQREEGQKALAIREIRSVKLFDVGPVVFPAYPATTTGIRGQLLSEMARQELLTERQAGPASIARACIAARLRAMEISEVR